MIGGRPCSADAVFGIRSVRQAERQTATRGTGIDTSAEAAVGVGRAIETLEGGIAAAMGWIPGAGSGSAVAVFVAGSQQVGDNIDTESLLAKYNGVGLPT